MSDIDENGCERIFIILGGTADITVHEKLSDGCLKELCRATGGDCGGTCVDLEYIQV